MSRCWNITRVMVTYSIYPFSTRQRENTRHSSGVKASCLDMLSSRGPLMWYEMLAPLVHVLQQSQTATPQWFSILRKAPHQFLDFGSWTQPAKKMLVMCPKVYHPAKIISHIIKIIITHALTNNHIFTTSSIFRQPWHSDDKEPVVSASISRYALCSQYPTYPHYSWWEEY